MGLTARSGEEMVGLGQRGGKIKVFADLHFTKRSKLRALEPALLIAVAIYRPLLRAVILDNWSMVLVTIMLVVL